MIPADRAGKKERKERKERERKERERKERERKERERKERKDLEQKFIFRLGALYSHGINERLSLY